jgi:hypothetical protein
MASRAVVTTSNRKGRSKRKTNMNRLYSAMNKLAVDAVDKEILKRFKILIDTADEDLTKAKVDEILKTPESVNISDYHESLQPYIRHHLFMVRRASK